MINILIDRLPMKIDGININTDFRISILFELMMQDNEISDVEKIKQALILYYPNFEKITDYKEAIQNIIWFYKGGKNENVDKEVKKNNSKDKQIYSNHLY